jgi:beta-glucosidase
MPESFRFPEGFLWGAATAGHQVEGHNVASDWWAFEQAGRVPFRSGEACRHLERYAEDFDLARSLGHNAHRFSVEWARIEPEPGQHDHAALDHYARVVEALHRRGLEPVLTLHHFVAPAWFTAQGGWLAPGAPERFAAYVERVVARLGGEVRWWLTVNEPTVWAKHAYVTGDWPPCIKGDWSKSLRGMRAMARGHRLAYRIIHRRRPDAMVGIAHSAPHVMPADPDRPLDQWAARLRDLGLNRLPLALLGRPLRRWLDFIGVNYYNRSLVRWAPRGRAILLGEDDERPRNGELRRFSDIGWEIWPAGLAATLRALAGHGLPLLVTENGIATRDEDLRVDYLLSHLREVARVIAEGVPVQGYLHWSLIDNFEWVEGFAPRFGLFAVDRATQARTPRPAAEIYAEICRSGRLSA